MRYQIPQFIERETKMFGPMSFRQFFYVGIVGLVIFVLYFTLARTNFMFFVLISIFLVIGALVLAFVQIEGKPVIAVITHFLFFSTSSRLYLWRKKEITPRLIRLDRRIKEEKDTDDGPVLKISGKGRLENLAMKIERK